MTKKPEQTKILKISFNPKLLNQFNNITNLSKNRKKLFFFNNFFTKSLFFHKNILYSNSLINTILNELINSPKYINPKELKNRQFNLFKQIKNYKYSRIILHLPLRGQRTHTNAKTRKHGRVL